MARSNTTWDPAQARLASAAGVEARKRNRAYRLANPPAKPPVNPVNPLTQAPGQPGPMISFIEKRLARVRAQLDRLDQLLSEATDSKEIKELADATARLQDQEQKLAGRPGPGTLKPVQPGNPRASTQPQAIPLPSPAKQGEPAPAVSEHLPSSNSTLHRAPLPRVEEPSTTSDQEAPDQPIDYGPLD